MDAHLRVHTDFISLSNLQSYIDRYCDKAYIAREEDATRPHYQGYVQFKFEYKNLESLRNLLKKNLSQKGNKVYSISLARESRYRHLAYMMKEGTPPVIQKNISILELKSAQELVDDFRRRQKMTPMEKLADSYSGDDSVENICKYIMEEWKHQGKMLPDPRLMKRYIQSIQFIKWPEVHQAKYLQEVGQLFSW